MKRHDERTCGPAPARESEVQARVFSSYTKRQSPLIVWLETATVPAEIVLQALQAEWGSNVRGVLAALQTRSRTRTHLIHCHSTPLMQRSFGCRSKFERLDRTDKGTRRFNHTRWDFTVACWPFKYARLLRVGFVRQGTLERLQRSAGQNSKGD